MSESMVYVVQSPHFKDRETGELRPKFDFREAETYGTLWFVLAPEANPVNPHHVDGIVETLHRTLRYYRPERDYLLLTGNPCLIGWACTAAAHYAGGELRCLQWSSGTYLPIEVGGLLPANAAV